MKKKLGELLKNGVSLKEIHQLSKVLDFSYKITYSTNFGKLIHQIDMVFNEDLHGDFIKDIDNTYFRGIMIIQLDNDATLKPSSSKLSLSISASKRMNESFLFIGEDKDNKHSIKKVRKYIKENKANIILKSFENTSKKETNFRFFKFENYAKPTTKSVGQTNQELINFKKIKLGVTKTGIKYVFCTLKGKGIIIEKTVLKELDLKCKAENYTISTNRYFLEKLNKKGISRLKLKVPPVMWKKIKELRLLLLDGLTWSELTHLVNDAKLTFSEVSHSEHGRFISIRPSESYKIDSRHKLNFYPGKSIMNSGIEEQNLLKYIEKNKKRLIFRSFEKNDRFYHRLYLQKVNNSFKTRKVVDHSIQTDSSMITITKEDLKKHDALKNKHLET